MTKRRNQARLAGVQNAAPAPAATDQPAVAPLPPAAARPETTPADSAAPGNGAAPAFAGARALPAAPWLTVEWLLWAGALLVAAAVRLFALGGFALTTREADLALSALNWFKGN